MTRPTGAAMLLLLLLLIGLPPAAAAPAGYYRQPSIHGRTIVFVAEGDLWSVDLEGGAARRLTTHPAAESHPAHSPDGRTLAFTACYEGPPEVYTMPVTGGLPERRTWFGEAATVVGWTPDGQILIATMHFSTLPSTQLAVIDLERGTIEPLPLAQAAEGVVDAAGALVFTRLADHGSHTRGYRGGTAQSLWRYAPGAEEAEPLTADFSGTSRWPLWWEGRIYFASDRDGTLNLWSMEPGGGDLRQHTHHDGWDLRDPALADGRIVYQLGADLHLYDIATDRDQTLTIGLTSDFDQARVRWVAEPLEQLSAVHLSPAGDRLALTAYGQVFVAPVEQGRLVEVTRRSGVRYRAARFTPDGRALLALSDESGEVEWWRLSPTATEAPVQLSRDGTTLRYDGVPSPDGRWIAHTDHDQRLWLFEIESRRSTLVAESPYWGIGDPAWSPDSRWLAYSLEGPAGLRRIHLHSLQTGSSTPVTSERFHSWDPQWSRDGRWLAFLSDRTFRSRVGSPWGPRAPEPYFSEQTGIYLLPLTAGLRSPFAPADELHPTPGEDQGRQGTPGAAKPAAAPDPPRVTIELDGIAERLEAIPAPPGNYSNLALGDERLFWIARTGDAEEARSLMALAIGRDDPEPETLAVEVEEYELSGNGRKLLVRKEESFHVIDAGAGSDVDLEEARVDLSRWTFPVDPREQWRQMLVDSWRLARDYFYDPGLHGLDWPGILQKYLPLVERVTERAELEDLQGRMASELGVLHVWVGGGEHREGPDRIEVASLGARIDRDPATGGWRIARLYRADPDEPDQRGPLDRPAERAAAGEWIAAINGTPLREVAHPGVLLRAQAGRQTRLTLVGPAGARDLILTPIDAERARDLRYGDWELERRARVDSLGAGEIGYVHLRAMGSDDIAQWQRDFYPVFNRRGLIVDLRHNQGGSIDSWILAKLLRRAWMYWQPRRGASYWNMHHAFRGHMVVLVDEWTMSDGEAFAEGFRRLGLGQVIGTRTWGGEIWLTSSNRLLDDGVVTAPEFAVYGPEGRWLIEGHGVEPDIVVDNPPHATFRGRDAQLEAAVAHLQALIASDRREPPPAPAYPARVGPR